RLLEVDRVAAAADGRELGLEARDSGDGVLRARHQHSGRAVEVIDLVVGEEREHRLPERGAVRRQPAADVADDVRLADPPTRVLPFDVDDVAVVEDGHLRGEAGAPRELAHRGPADLAHRELVQVRVAKLRDAEVETPAVSVDGRRYEAAML